MSTKTDTLIHGLVNSTIPKMEYAKCPICKSVNCKVLIEDEDRVTFQCLECNHSFWKTKL
jgi:translation initiation factor 2 beta subunit (eIF-2beta)/eIF-5